MTKFSIPNSSRVLAISVLACGFTAQGWAQFTQQGLKLVGPGALGNAHQGSAVAVSGDGNTMVSGGSFDNSGPGAAWFYARSGGVWGAGVKKIGAVGTGSSNQGFAVAMSGDGNTAIVGGPADNSNKGGAWIYAKSGGSWSAQGKPVALPGDPIGPLVYSSSTAAAQQGYSVALSGDGNTALVGAPFDATSGSGAGSAYVYTRSGDTWYEQARLFGSGAVGGAQQGYSVSLSSDGNTALIGANADQGGTGSAWIFSRSGSTWTQVGSKLTGTSSVGLPQQGASVALSANGQTAVVGGNLDNGGAGAVWVFGLSGGVWTQIGNKLVGSGGTAPHLGNSVAVSGDGSTVIAGGPADSSGIGALWTFARSGSGPSASYSQFGTKVTASDSVVAPAQGGSVSLSVDGGTAAVGGSNDNSGAGATWVYTVPNLSITNVHNGTFSRGASGTYTLTVKNQTGGPTSGTVRVLVGSQASASGVYPVTYAMPAGLTLTGLSGAAWTCSVATQICSSNSVLTAGSSNTITVTVNVTSAAPSTIVFTASIVQPDPNPAHINAFVLGSGGEINTSNDSATDLVTLPIVPDLVISKSHSANLYWGQTNVPYTIRVSNSNANSKTTGTVTVVDTLPAGLSLVSMAGTNWACAGLTCTRSDALAGGAAYEPIIVTVNVAGNAPATVINTATVSGGGELNTSNNVANDSAKVGASGPDMTVSLSHSIPFKFGQTGTYWIIASNNGLVNTKGTVTVQDTLPAGLTATSIAGNGWKCVLGTLTCTRADSLPPGLSYRYIAVTVSISSGASASVTNTATVSGGGESVTSNNSANDVTTIIN